MDEHEMKTVVGTVTFRNSDGPEFYIKFGDEEIVVRVPETNARRNLRELFTYVLK